MGVPGRAGRRDPRRRRHGAPAQPPARPGRDHHLAGLRDDRGAPGAGPPDPRPGGRRGEPGGLGAVRSPARGHRAGRRARLHPAGPLHRRPRPCPGRPRRRDRAHRARRAAADAGPADGRRRGGLGRPVPDRGLPGGQRDPLRGRPRHVRGGVRAPAGGRGLAAVLLRLAGGDHDQRRAGRGRPVAGPRRRHDHGLSGDAGVGDPGDRHRPRPPGAVGGADVDGAPRRRGGQLLPRLRRPRAAPGHPGRRAAAGDGRGGHRRRPDGPHAAAHARLGRRRRPPDPPGAAHRGLLPDPRPPRRRRHGRARRQGTRDLGVHRGRGTLGPPRPGARGPPAARSRARGRPARTARGLRPGRTTSWRGRAAISGCASATGRGGSSRPCGRRRRPASRTAR